jgi:low temperature requirement protein LtrA
MAAFLVQALAIPNAFGDSGRVFGFAYLAVVLIHSALFLVATRSIGRVAVFNVGSALLVIAAGFANGGAAKYWLWGAAMLVQFVTPYIAGISDIRVEPAHFVERHGLLMLVAFGESVVAIGIGAAGLPIHPGVIAGAVLGLALVACLWWAYFAGDTERAEHAPRTAAPDRRPWLAFEGFFYARVPMLLGVISIAAGVSSALGHFGEPLATGPAAALAGGVLLYLAGDVAFRRRLGIGSGVRVRWRRWWRWLRSRWDGARRRCSWRRWWWCFRGCSGWRERGTLGQLLDIYVELAC